MNSHTSMRRIRSTVMLGCAFGLLLGRTPSKWFEKPLSPRIANYTIEAVLDWDSKRLQGHEVLTWRNTGTTPTEEFPLHLYLNAFKSPNSLFFKERGATLDRPNDESPHNWGYCSLLALRMEGRILQGHSGEDETVYWVRLPRQVHPGETIQVEIDWEARFPQVVSRSGWGGHFLMGAQWFPKVGVYQGDHWNCHAYHAATEFFSDFGVYDVEISAPKRIRFANTGTIVPQGAGKEDDCGAAPDPRRDPNYVWKFHAEDVHDFAWAAWPHGALLLRSGMEDGVEIRTFTQPAHMLNARRQHEAVKAALRSAAAWYFPYPYPVLTVVDVPEEAAAADGMEYPTFLAASSGAFDPMTIRYYPEVLNIHEFGHQIFYGVLASNEFEDPWLDEGITSWFTHKVMARTYGSLFRTRRFQVETDALEWLMYWENPSMDPLNRIGFKVKDPQSTTAVFYGKGQLVLNQLEAELGRPMMAQVMRAYAKEMQFQHPTLQDFRHIAERVASRDLSGFWRDFMEGTDVLDYAIQNVTSMERQEGGWMDSGHGLVFSPLHPVPRCHRGSITLICKGGIRVPITLGVDLEDGSKHLLNWDGQDRWTTFEFDSPVTSAVLDPDGNYPMLKDRLHASYSARPTRCGLYFWSQMVCGALTGILQGIGLG